MDNPTILIAVGAGVLLLLVFVLIAARMRGSRKDDLEDRLGIYTDASSLLQFSEEFEKEQREKEKGKKKDKNALTERVDEVVGKTQFGSNARIQLARADLKLTVGEYVGLHVISIVGTAATLLVVSSQPLLAIVGIGVGFFIPRFWVGSKISGRLKKFESQLPDLLSLWVNSLRAGFSVLQALEAIAKEAPEPTASEIRRVVREVQLGIPMETAFDNMLKRLPSPELDLCFTAVNIQREVGGNLAEILEIIGHTIRERIKILGEIRVLTAQGRITGLLISVLPILLLFVLYGINPSYVGLFFTEPGCGLPMLGIGLGMIGAGIAVIGRIVDIEV